MNIIYLLLSYLLKGHLWWPLRSVSGQILFMECKCPATWWTTVTPHLLLLSLSFFCYASLGISPFHNLFTSWLIGLVGSVFANGPGDLSSIPGRVIPKTLKIVFDTSLLNAQQYKVCIEGKVDQSRERSCALPYTSV